jgi:hypothetical protein
LDVVALDVKLEVKITVGEDVVHIIYLPL